MSPLSVAIWHNLPSGGGKRALRQQIIGLLERGHRVKVWAPDIADNDFLSMRGVVEERVLPWNPTHPTRLERVLDPLANWKASVREMKRICASAASQMQKEDFDVILAHSCQHFVVPPIANNSRLPCLLYLQEPNRGVYEARPELRWVTLRPLSPWPWSPASLRRWRELARVGAAANYEREEASKYARILVNSCFSRETIARVYGLDAHVCYLGVDVDLFQPSSEAKEPFVIGVGAAEPHKGLLLALSAVAMLSDSLPRRLVWISNKISESYVEEARRHARDLNVEFDLRHRIDDRELVRLLSRASAFVYSSALEPFGFAPLEAMACGTPVVTVAEGGVREYVEHGANGLLVNERSAKALAAQLTMVLQTPALAAQLGEEARRTCMANWTLGKAADRLESQLVEAIRH